MIKAMTFVQCAWEAILGVVEVTVTVRYRVRTAEPVRRAKARKRALVVHRGFRDLPLFRRGRSHGAAPAKLRAPLQPMTPAVVVPIDPPAPLVPVPPPAPPPKRSSHPSRVSLAERASWIKLPRGWDDGRPRLRSECRGDKRCPECGHQVAMRIEDGEIICPDCKKHDPPVKTVVGYAKGLNGSDWYWAKVGQPGVVSSPARIPQRALNKCRPCPWAGCRSHLWLIVDDSCGSLKLNHLDTPPDQMETLAATCAEDVAESDDGRVGFEPKLLPLEVVGKHLGITLERTRQLEEEALAEMKLIMERRERKEAG